MLYFLKWKRNKKERKFRGFIIFLLGSRIFQLVDEAQNDKVGPGFNQRDTNIFSSRHTFFFFSSFSNCWPCARTLFDWLHGQSSFQFDCFLNFFHRVITTGPKAMFYNVISYDSYLLCMKEKGNILLDFHLNFQSLIHMIRSSYPANT